MNAILAAILRKSVESGPERVTISLAPLPSPSYKEPQTTITVKKSLAINVLIAGLLLSTLTGLDLKSIKDKETVINKKLQTLDISPFKEIAVKNLQILASKKETPLSKEKFKEELASINKMLANLKFSKEIASPEAIKLLHLLEHETVIAKNLPLIQAAKTILETKELKNINSERVNETPLI